MKLNWFSVVKFSTNANAKDCMELLHFTLQFPGLINQRYERNTIKDDFALWHTHIHIHTKYRNAAGNILNKAEEQSFETQIIISFKKPQDKKKKKKKRKVVYCNDLTPGRGARKPSWLLITVFAWLVPLLPIF